MHEFYRNITSWFIILHPQSVVKHTSGMHDGDTAGSMDSPELKVEGWGANLSTESSITHIRPLRSIDADPADMRCSLTFWSLRSNPPCLLESRNIRQTSTAHAFLKTRHHSSSTWTRVSGVCVLSMCHLHPCSAGMPSARLVGAWRHACTSNAWLCTRLRAAIFAFCVISFPACPAPFYKRPPRLKKGRMGCMMVENAHSLQG